MPDGRQHRASQNAAPFHCLIAGAGIGGLTAALLLAKAGMRVTIIEREPALLEVGAGIQLSPNATRVLDHLGIVDQLGELAVDPRKFVVRSGTTGKVLTETVFGEAAAERFGAPFLVVHRADLQGALAAQARANEAITLRLGLRLHEIDEQDDRVSGVFEAQGGAHERIEADLLIGADGLWSRARVLAGLPGQTRYSGLTAWRTLVPRMEAPLFAREADVNLWLGPDAHLVHYPVCGGEKINIVAIIEDDWREEGWSAPGNPDVITSHFRRWTERARGLVSAGESWSRWALIDRAPESRWSRARMTLLGDAAHPMMPFLAQGASQAIEDSAALARRLGGLAAGQSPRKALTGYDLERIRHTARIQKEARRQGQIYHLAGIGASLRDTALKVLPGDRLLSRYAWIFTNDALAGSGR